MPEDLASEEDTATVGFTDKEQLFNLGASQLSGRGTFRPNDTLSKPFSRDRNFSYWLLSAARVTNERGINPSRHTNGFRRFTEGITHPPVPYQSLTVVAHILISFPVSFIFYRGLYKGRLTIHRVILLDKVARKYLQKYSLYCFTSNAGFKNPSMNLPMQLHTIPSEIVNFLNDVARIHEAGET